NDFIVHVANDMIAQIVFTDADQAMVRRVFAEIVKGIFTGMVFGFVTGPLGTFIAWAALSVLLYETLYLLVLKSIQIALLVSQYMFAPLFLVFFASPSTENTATQFVRSCVEISLWTFVWIGQMRILVLLLNTDIELWGKIPMVIGVLQLMMSVPHFMAKAQ